MKALILNSGMGKRMSNLTEEHPKCMTEIGYDDTILKRQLKMLKEVGITDIVITTGYLNHVLINYCESLNIPLNISYVHNDRYAETNYIYSIYKAIDKLDDDILLLHGDIVMENSVLDAILANETSCVAVSSTAEIPEKDFKAVISHGKISKIGIEFFEDAVAAWPVYKLLKKDKEIWFEEIKKFCEAGMVSVYAEDAMNRVSDQCEIYPLDIRNDLCLEIDSPMDLAVVKSELSKVKQRTVYMCFSTDILHSGHISIMKKAMRFGKLIIGVLSDKAIASYKRYPLVPFEDRKELFATINGVYQVVEQRELSYRKNLEKYKPDFVVHGDDWKAGFQKPIRDEVVSTLSEYGGRLVEYPYSEDERYKKIEQQMYSQLSIPDMRRGRLRKLLALKGFVTAVEVHSGITGLIAEKTVLYENGEARQFDAMWVSSLCDSTNKGKSDIELVDISSRINTINDIMEVTTKPIILDGDTGGLTEHFVYTVKTLERMGVSAIIIEDKIGLKKNSLFGTQVEQIQDSIEHFAEKIAAGKKAQKTSEFMIIARIESLILEQGMEDALVRARAFVEAGADAIMIHSRRKEPDEIFEFVEKFRAEDETTPIVVVPTSFNEVTEEEFMKRKVNIVIYANQLTRSGIPAMQKTAETILKYHRAKEADDMCMPIKEILTIIPEEQ